MPRARQWTPEEDAALAAAARANLAEGVQGQGPGGAGGRLEDLARRLGRTYVAVRTRASKLGLPSRGGAVKNARRPSDARAHRVRSLRLRKPPGWQAEIVRLMLAPAHRCTREGGND